MQRIQLFVLLMGVSIIINACNADADSSATATSIPSQTLVPPTLKFPTQVPTNTVVITKAPATATQLLATSTLAYIPVFPPDIPDPGRVCGEYTVVPIPTDPQAVAYLRVFALEENLWFEPVVVELGVFVLPDDLKEVGGKIVYHYDGQTQLMLHSAIYLADAPTKVQKTLTSGALITAIEIVDLQNKSMPYFASGETIDNLVYNVDDLLPHPIIDVVLPCSSFVDGHAISYASTKTQEP